MNRFLVCLSVAALASGPAAAQDWAKARLEKSPRHGEWVKVKHGDREVTSFVVFPEVKDKATAVVVIHEIFGLTDWVRSVADQLAEAGFIAIAPDLLSGSGPKGGGTDSFKGEEVRKAIMGLPPDQVTADLNAAAEYVSKLPACNGKVAVAGFCWGGGQAFRFATNNKAIRRSNPASNSRVNRKAISKRRRPISRRCREISNKANRRDRIKREIRKQMILE